MLLASSPYQHAPRSVSQVMLLVCAALVPGILVQAYFFGAGIWIQLILAIAVALASEALFLLIRHKPIGFSLKDNSALLTALLLAVSIPPLSPWWVVVIGTAFAIIIVKQLYGGLGQNLFNPAMMAYVLLLISFPVEMTSWLPPNSLSAHPVSLADATSLIFSDYSVSGYSLSQLTLGIDGVSMATPLDTVKTGLSQNFTLSELYSNQIFDGLTGTGWFWVNISYLIGGLVLLRIRVIYWQIPTAFIAGLTVTSLLFFAIDSDQFASPWFHWFSGATMLGAFFIATDPVSASTTPRGRLIYGALIGILVYVIRVWGGYPDGVAFAVVIANMVVPLIDYYTKPKSYGQVR